MSRSSLELGPGQIFGPYVVDEELGIGGTAVVWRGRHHDDHSHHPVALKVILPHVCRQPQFIELFVREAAFGAGLSHPNLIHVYDFGVLHERFFIEMEFVRGRTLRQVLQRLDGIGASVPWPVALAVGAECCDALAHIHDHRDASGRRLGLVHRDVSPENIMVGFEGATKLLDMGVATTQLSALTVSGELKGKLPYVAPEALAGASADAGWDIYALGATLYELLTGRRPFTGRSEAELMFQITNAPLVPPIQIRHDLPPEVDRQIVAALSREPSSRCGGDVAALGRSLRALIDEPAPRDMLAGLMRMLFIESGADAPVPAGAAAAHEDDPEASLSIRSEPVMRRDASEQAGVAAAFSKTHIPQAPTSSVSPGALFSSSPRPAPSDNAANVFALYRRTSDVSTGNAEQASESPEESDEPTQDALLHFERGLELRRDGRLEAALAEWEVASKLDPGNQTLLTNVRRLRQKME